MDSHLRCGYAVLALLLFRIIWGVIGSSSARFSNFISSPAGVLDYFSRMRNREVIFHATHNPAGGWMVLALLGLMMLISTSGLFANDDISVEGPLAHLVSERISDLFTAIHAKGFYILLILVVLHLAAIVFYLLVKKENLVRPMLSGFKPLPQGLAAPEIRIGSLWLACLVFCAASGAVWLLIRFI